jgi:hypothetical protein
MATAAALGPARVDAILRDLDRETGRFPSLRLHRMTHEAYALTLEGRVDDGIRLRQEAASGAVDLYGYVLPSGHEWTWRIHMLADRPAVAEEAIRQGYERTVASGDLMHASTFAGEWALACVRLGRFDDARRLSAECRTTSATDDVINQMLWRRVDARLAAIEDDLDRAIDLIKGAVEAAERTDMLVDTAQTYLEAADVYALAGRREDARAAASRARELAARKGASLVVGLAERRLSELEHA